MPAKWDAEWDAEWMRRQVDEIFDSRPLSRVADRIELIAALVTVGVFFGFVIGLA